MIVLTGGAGFIGSNILLGLNKKGHSDIWLVDDLTDGKKYRNLVEGKFLDYQDAEDFLQYVKNDRTFPQHIEAVIHQGACSVTTEWNGRYMMKNNYEYSKELFHYCINRKIPFIYASSAAVYGKTKRFNEADVMQFSLNVYGYSKWVFDQYVLRHRPFLNSQVVGLRYFNV